MDEDLAADLARVDASYPGFPDPSEWAGLDVDMSAWDDAASALAKVRETDPALGLELRDRAFREAGLDTGAIEGLYTTDRGFTMTVADATSLDEAARYVRSHKGPDVEELFRAQVEGYEMALDLIVQERPLTEVWIRELHQVIVGPQDTYEVATPIGPQVHVLSKGEYKRHPNHVRQPDGTTFAYAPVSRVADEMHRLVELANSDAVRSMHPVLAAAWLHYALVRIHPFADGNGRVTRVVASLPLLKASSTPFRVSADRRDAYLDALERVDAGDQRAFIRFAREESTSEMRLLTALSRPAGGPSSTIVVDSDGPDVGVYLLAAKRLFGLSMEALDDAIIERGSDRIRTTAHRPNDRPNPSGWIDAGELDDEIPGFGVRKDTVGVIRILLSVRVMVATHLGIGTDLMLEVDGPGLDEVFSITEIDPLPTQAFRLRLAAWAGRVRDAALLSLGG